MKAAVFKGVGQFKVEDVPIPEVQEGDILLRVKACAICGTDIKIINHGHRAVKPPRILGHEICAEVAEVGKNVNDYKQGEQVVVVTPVGCGECRFCKKNMQNMCSIVSKDVHSLGYYCDGGFAQYMLVPKEAVLNNNLIKTSKDLPPEYGALVEPLSCVINGQELLDINSDTNSVAIIGAGPIGLMHCIMAKALGGKKIILIDVNNSRLSMAKERNIADIYINSKEEDLLKRAMEETGGIGVEVVIVACASGQAQEQALELSSIRGRISFFGGLPKDSPYIKLNSNDLHYGEKSIYGAFASNHGQYQKALELIESGKVDVSKLISRRFLLGEIDKAIEAIKSGQTLKVIINP